MKFTRKREDRGKSHRGFSVGAKHPRKKTKTHSDENRDGNQRVTALELKSSLGLAQEDLSNTLNEKG